MQVNMEVMGHGVYDHKALARQRFLRRDGGMNDVIVQLVNRVEKERRSINANYL